MSASFGEWTIYSSQHQQLNCHKLETAGRRSLEIIANDSNKTQGKTQNESSPENVYKYFIRSSSWQRLDPFFYQLNYTVMSHNQGMDFLLLFPPLLSFHFFVELVAKEKKRRRKVGGIQLSLEFFFRTSAKIISCDQCQVKFNNITKCTRDKKYLQNSFLLVH